MRDSMSYKGELFVWVRRCTHKSCPGKGSQQLLALVLVGARDGRGTSELL